MQPRRKGAGGRPGRAVLGPNVSEAKVTKPKDKTLPKKKKRLTYLERIAECDVSEELRVSISLALKKLETSDDMKELELPSSLSSEERKYVHIVSQQMGFKSKSRGLLEERRLVLMKKEASERPLRQRSWKRLALRYGGVQELLKQREDRRKARDLEAENDRLVKLEEEKSKIFDFVDPSPTNCSNNNGSSTSKPNEPSEAQSSRSYLNDKAHPSYARLPMRRNEAARHLHHPGIAPAAARRCSEGDESFNDHYGRYHNRSPHPRPPSLRGYHAQRESFGPLRNQGDRPLPYDMHEAPHSSRCSASSPAHSLPPREGAEGYSRTPLRGHSDYRRDHFNAELGRNMSRAEPGPVPYDFLSRPPPSRPYLPSPLCDPSLRRRHSLHSPGFFNAPPSLANSRDFGHYSSQENIRSSEYSVIAPSEPKWSDYGYYSNDLGDGDGPEFSSCSTGDFYSGAAPPNAPSGANVAFPPPDHSVIKAEPPEVKYEPYDPLLEPSGDPRRSSMSSYESSDVSTSQAGSSHYSAPPSRFPVTSYHSSSYSNISVKVEPSQDEHSGY